MSQSQKECQRLKQVRFVWKLEAYIEARSQKFPQKLESRPQVLLRTKAQVEAQTAPKSQSKPEVCVKAGSTLLGRILTLLRLLIVKVKTITQFQ